MINLTESAKIHLLTSLKQRKSSIGIRLGVKTTGCSGLAYTLDYVDICEDDDLVFNVSDIQIIVKSADYNYLDQLTIDYIKNNLNKELIFDNPKEKYRCGCGLSFNV